MCVDCVQPPVFGKSIFNGVPFPTCNCHVSGSDRTVILKRNFCDHARVLKCTGRNECQSASTFSGGLGAIKFVSKGLSDQALFSAANDWRSQQWMNWRLVVYGWNRVAEPKRGLDGSNGSGELLNETLFRSLAHARAVLEAWRADYNHERPHSRLDWMSPAIYAAARQSAALRSTDGSAPRTAAITAQQGITDRQTPIAAG